MFHLSFCVISVFFAIWAAEKMTYHISKDKSLWIMNLCGIILAFGELYKQLFLYVIVNHGKYDWWYFPFQLCSTPMYLCLILPLIKKYPSIRQIICTYLQNFCLLGGIMALIEPSGLYHPYWSLTLHGLLWHVLLIFLGLFSGLSGMSGHGWREYSKTLVLFGVFCLIASGINFATKVQADMFYISPYYPVTQIIFNEISLRYGIFIGIISYLFSICLGGFLLHLLVGIYAAKRNSSPKRRITDRN